MNTNSQTTKRRNVFYALLILAVTLGMVATIVFLLSTDQGQYFIEGIRQRLSGRLRL